MKILIYSAKDFEIPFLEKANSDQFQVKYIPEQLTCDTARLALGFDAISIFSADDGSSRVLERLKDFGIKYISLRSAGYDNVNLKKAQKLGIKIANTPGYAPEAIAEHGIALLLALQRKLILANQQVKDYNFSLSNLVSLDIYKKTVGIIGTGKIGKVIAKVMNGFNCDLLGYDPYVDHNNLKDVYQIVFTDLNHLCQQADIIFLSLPLTSETHHLINATLIEQMKSNVVLINIGRGAIVHTKDIISALTTKRIKAYGTDVYEYESNIFFHDHSKNKLKDELLKKLIDLPNVLLTPHQAFATENALITIAETTFYNMSCWACNGVSVNELTGSMAMQL